MKSRKVNYIIEVVGEVVIEDEDKDEDLESVDSALWQQLEVYSEDVELEGFGGDVWEEEVEEAALELSPAPAPLRRSNRRK
jgi:hypothetical protein